MTSSFSNCSMKMYYVLVTSNQQKQSDLEQRKHQRTATVLLQNEWVQDHWRLYCLPRRIGTYFSEVWENWEQQTNHSLQSAFRVTSRKIWGSRSSWKLKRPKTKMERMQKNYMYRMRGPPNRLEVQKLKRKVKLSAESLDDAFVDNPWSYFFQYWCDDKQKGGNQSKASKWEAGCFRPDGKKIKQVGFVLDEADVAFEGYDAFCSKQINNKEHRGTIVYVRQDIGLQSSRVEINGYPEDTILVQLCTGKKEKILFGCVYRHWNSDTQEQQALMNTLRAVSHMNFTHEGIVGAFNFPKIDWSLNWTPLSENSNEHSITELVRDCFWHQHVQFATRGRGSDDPSILDLVFTDADTEIDDMQCQASFGKSDHSVISFEISQVERTRCKKGTRWKYAKGDYENMSEVPSNNHWVDVLSTAPNVNEAWNLVKERISAAVEKFVPKAISGSTKQFSFPLDKDLLQQIRKKNSLWRKYLRVKTKTAYNEFCRARNYIRSRTRSKAREIEDEIAREAKPNPMRFWTFVNSKVKARTGISDLVLEDGKVVSSDTRKAEVLNTYFSSVFVEEETPPPEIDEFVFDSYIEEPLITESAIRKKLAELNRTKSPGFDEIQPHVLAELSEVLTEPLQIFFSSTNAESELPEDWKEARVTALFKKGDKKKVENYRPVSLTCIACKVLESIIRDDIISHMTSNNLISDRQYGFVKGRSTSLQLLKVLEEWTQILDRGGGIDCVYCDFQKAFDKVPYRRLMAKIWSYGIRGKLYRWIETSPDKQEATCGCQRSKNVQQSSLEWSPAGKRSRATSFSDLHKRPTCSCWE